VKLSAGGGGGPHTPPEGGAGEEEEDGAAELELDAAELDVDATVVESDGGIVEGVLAANGEQSSLESDCSKELGSFTRQWAESRWTCCSAEPSTASTVL